MTEARVIKRYANRKLYDTQHSRYVTLDQISEMIRNGDDVKIIDNKTKEDLTSVTLAQIIFEEEKKQRSFLSLQTMRDLIQNGGESLSHLVNEAQRRVTKILPLRKDGEGVGEEYAGHPPADAAIEDASDPRPDDADGHAAEAHGTPARRGRDGLASLREFREWLQQSQRTIDEWQRRVDERIRDMVEGISPFSGLHKDVRVLGSRIAELEAKLTQLAQDEARVEARVEAFAGGTPGDHPAASGEAVGAAGPGDAAGMAAVESGSPDPTGP